MIPQLKLCDFLSLNKFRSFLNQNTVLNTEDWRGSKVANKTYRSIGFGLTRFSLGLSHLFQTPYFTIVGSATPSSKIYPEDNTGPVYPYLIMFLNYLRTIELHD